MSESFQSLTAVSGCMTSEPEIAHRIIRESKPSNMHLNLLNMHLYTNICYDRLFKRVCRPSMALCERTEAP